MSESFRQCELHKGSLVRVAWIPSKFAKVGKIVRLHDDDGWRVVKVTSKMSSDFIRNREYDYRYQRRASDI